MNLESIAYITAIVVGVLASLRLLGCSFRLRRRRRIPFATIEDYEFLHQLVGELKKELRDVKKSVQSNAAPLPMPYGMGDVRDVLTYTIARCNQIEKKLSDYDEFPEIPIPPCMVGS